MENRVSLLPHRGKQMLPDLFSDNRQWDGGSERGGYQLILTQKVSGLRGSLQAEHETLIQVPGWLALPISRLENWVRYKANVWSRKNCFLGLLHRERESIVQYEAENRVPQERTTLWWVWGASSRKRGVEMRVQCWLLPCYSAEHRRLGLEFGIRVTRKGPAGQARLAMLPCWGLWNILT